MRANLFIFIFFTDLFKKKFFVSVNLLKLLHKPFHKKVYVSAYFICFVPFHKDFYVSANLVDCFTKAFFFSPVSH